MGRVRRARPGRADSPGDLPGPLEEFLGAGVTATRAGLYR